MQAGVDPILERRLHPAEPAVKVAALSAALALHVTIAAAAVYGPKLFHRPPPPLRVLPVKLVPVRALGVETPQPRTAPRPAKKAPEVASEKPAPAKPAAKPVAPAPAAPAKRTPPQPAPAAPEAAAAQREGSPRGSPLGVSGKLGSEVGVDNPDFVYDYYLDRMLGLIEAQWTRPPIDRPIEAHLHFQILRDGRLAELEIVGPSGSNPFDLAAFRAVQNAAPFPPLPTSYRGDSLGVNLIVH